MTMHTTVEQVDGDRPVTVLALAGELDASNFQEVIDTVKALYDEGTRRLLIDLTDLRFMASSGLVALHSIVRILHGEQPRIRRPVGEHSTASVAAAADGGPACGPQPASNASSTRTGLSDCSLSTPTALWPPRSRRLPDGAQRAAMTPERRPRARPRRGRRAVPRSRAQPLPGDRRTPTGRRLASTSLERPAGDAVTREIPAGALVGGRSGLGRGVRRRPRTPAVAGRWRPPSPSASR